MFHHTSATRGGIHWLLRRLQPNQAGIHMNSISTSNHAANLAYSSAGTFIADDRREPKLDSEAAARDKAQRSSVSKDPSKPAPNDPTQDPGVPGEVIKWAVDMSMSKMKRPLRSFLQD